MTLTAVAIDLPDTHTYTDTHTSKGTHTLACTARRGMARSLRSVTGVLFSLRGKETEERRRETAKRKRKKRSSQKMWGKGCNSDFSQSHLEQISYRMQRRGRVCGRLLPSAFVRPPRRLEDSGGGGGSHCVPASIWLVTRLFLVPYRLSIRRRGSQDRRPFY